MSEDNDALEVINGEYADSDVEVKKVELAAADPINQFLAKLNSANPSINLSKLVDSDEAIEKFAQRRERLTKLAIKLTKTKDWIDYGGNPSLWSPGAERIARDLGISLYFTTDPTFKEYLDHGQERQYRSEVKIIAYHPELGLSAAVGIRTTESDFFKTDIEANLKKSATKNAITRVVKQIMGLNNLEWEYLTECNSNITKDGSTSVKYEAGKKGGSTDSEWDKETTTKAKWIFDWIKEMTGGDVEAFKKYLKDISEFTLSSGKDKGKVIQGKEEVSKLTPGRIKVVHEKVKDEYEKFKKEHSNGGTTEDGRHDRAGDPRDSDPGPGDDIPY